MALSISHLSKTYPNGVRALQDVSLTIGNELFGLVGPNGAGKSTLMRTVATLQDPDSAATHTAPQQQTRQRNHPRKKKRRGRKRPSPTCPRSSASTRRSPPSTCSA